MNIQPAIAQFILDDLLSGSRPDLDPDEPLFSSGLLDSLGTLRLITFLEERFGVHIGDGELADQNFGTLKRISELVARKLGSPGTAAT